MNDKLALSNLWLAWHFQTFYIVEEVDDFDCLCLHRWPKIMLLLMPKWFSPHRFCTAHDSSFLCTRFRLHFAKSRSSQVQPVLMETCPSAQKLAERAAYDLKAVESEANPRRSVYDLSY